MDSKFQHELRERFNPEGSRLRIHQLKLGKDYDGKGCTETSRKRYGTDMAII